ncbi:hypothetical protein CPB86DRAFT_58285 [Serendipita vermifera]|nr:hypothetical protein CPB86DRAFT_58285 [Serendipita vermifera]
MTDSLPFPHPRHSPTQTEVLLHKSLLEGLEKDIESTQKQINRLQSRLQHLEHTKANYLSYISPLRRLPVDVLSEIVHFCIQSGIEITLLTQICGSLRDVVIGSSTLWKNIFLGPKHSYLRTVYRQFHPVRHLSLIY